MLRSLDKNGKPKAKKDLSKEEAEYVERAERRAVELRINGELTRKTREEARKTLGV